jgi:thioredoxin 1
MINEPIHVSDENFENTVLKSTIPVIVDFWAEWCTPCKMVAPTLEKLASEYAGKLLVAKVNVDNDQKYAEKYGVQGIPTMLFISKGNIIHQQVGALPENMLRQAVTTFLEVTEGK